MCNNLKTSYFCATNLINKKKKLIMFQTMPNLPVDEICNNDDEEGLTTNNNNNREEILSTLEENIIDNNIQLLDNVIEEASSNNNCFSIINPAFVEDDFDDNNHESQRSNSSMENPFLDWSFVQDFFTSDDGRPPTPPPRSSSIQEVPSPRKEITIVVHMVSSPSKTPDISLNNEVTATNSLFQFNNEIENIDTQINNDAQMLYNNEEEESIIQISTNNPFYNDIENHQISNNNNQIINYDNTSQNTTNNLSNFDLISPRVRIENNIIEDSPHCSSSNIFPVVPDLLCHSIRHHNDLDDVDDIQSSSLRHEQDKNIITPNTSLSNLQGETSNNSNAVEMSTIIQNTVIPNINTEYQQLQQTNSEDEEVIDSGFIPRFVRASMRRVRRFRLSTRISNNRDTENNEEDINDVTISTTVEDTTIDLSTIIDDDIDNDRRDSNNEDVSDIASTITDTINERYVNFHFIFFILKLGRI
jgi:hypothetical protein